jgi:CDP-glucose 4,6-dehydratase
VGIGIAAVAEISMKTNFGGAFSGKKVLVTGHTGFKGTWLTAWLLRLGAEVHGFSRDIPTQPAMFESLGLAGRIRHRMGDVGDLEALRQAMDASEPDFVFHLAAQAIVSRSYSDPVETLRTNVMGTAHVLETLRGTRRPTVAVLITSDKCYDNVEWSWGYRENDALGGKDIYSGSKGAAELAIRSYQHSFFPAGSPVRLGVARAGNVIGGGDWAQDRIVADCVRAWSEGRPVEIRSPQATRPWQHVLEPLSGYLALAQRLAAGPELHGEAFNFGPRAEQNRTVVELLGDLSRHWGFADPAAAYRITANVPFHEAGLLKLNCDKALMRLRWEPTLDYSETVRLVGDWYRRFYAGAPDMHQHTLAQIGEYESLAAARRRRWTA